MQEPTDISQKIFSELKEILKNLSESSAIGDYLNKNEEFIKIKDYTTFLKIYNDFDQTTDSIVKETNFNDREILESSYLKNEFKTEDDNVLNFNDKDPEESSEIEANFDIESKEHDNFEIEEKNTDEEHSDYSDKSEEKIVNNYSAISESEVLENINYSALDFEAEDEMAKTDDEDLFIKEKSAVNEFKEPENLEEYQIEEEQQEVISEAEVEKLELKHQEERKFRLSNIKGVKKMETLFEDHFFEENQVLEVQQKDENIKKGEVSLDFMEAEKAIPVFKLDLNDRIAFTKKLFSGSQSDLNNAVSRLNEFATLDDAKEYLSELYYEKNWDKEDEFAQRLWNLVESKFQ